MHSEPLRSQPTRDRILGAAKRLFAEHGFEKTTIRAVAQAAGVHASMVMRYYGSKEGLFAKAARIDFRLPELALLPLETRGTALINHILDSWEGPNNEELQALLRAAGTHPLARQRLAELVQEQAVPVIRRAISGDHVDERLGLIVIQIAGLVLSRHFLKHPSVLALDRETIVRRLGNAVQVYLSE